MYQKLQNDLEEWFIKLLHQMEPLKINYNLVPTTNDNLLAVVHWFDGSKFKVECRVSPDKNVLINYINAKKKDIVIEILTSYINHRDYAIIKQFTENKQSKIQAIYRLKQFLVVYKKSSLFKVCQMICFLETDLLLIMPGTNSKYHKHYNNIINQLINYCKFVNHGK